MDSLDYFLYGVPQDVLWRREGTGGRSEYKHGLENVNLDLDQPYIPYSPITALVIILTPGDVVSTRSKVWRGIWTGPVSATELEPAFWYVR